MRNVSTGRLADFLADPDGTFTINSISLPMLKAYLCVKKIDSKALQNLAARRKTKACDALLNQRNEQFRTAFGSESELQREQMFQLINRLRKREDHHLAYLVQKNNANLFMLENYLLLCSRLDKVTHSQEAFRSYKPLF
jgi:hypothetical protein